VKNHHGDLRRIFTRWCTHMGNCGLRRSHARRTSPSLECEVSVKHELKHSGRMDELYESKGAQQSEIEANRLQVKVKNDSLNVENEASPKGIERWNYEIEGKSPEFMVKSHSLKPNDRIGVKSSELRVDNDTFKLNDEKEVFSGRTRRWNDELEVKCELRVENEHCDEKEAPSKRSLNEFEVKDVDEELKLVDVKPLPEDAQLRQRGDFNGMSFARAWEICRLLKCWNLDGVEVSRELKECSLFDLRGLMVKRGVSPFENLPEQLDSEFKNVFQGDEQTLCLSRSADELGGGQYGLIFALKMKKYLKEDSCCDFDALEAFSRDKTFRFGRKFGFDRFLYVHFPEGSKRFTDDIKLLGRTYRFLFGDKERTIFFAVKGQDLPFAISISQVINWHIPLHRSNLDQGICKFFNRMSLGFTRTDPLVLLETDQIKECSDIVIHGEVLTDGAAPASIALFQRISQVLALDSLPCAFQGRIGQFKGVWYQDLSDPQSPCEIYAKVRPAMRKYELSVSDSFQLVVEVKRLIPGDLSPALNMPSNLNVQYVRALQYLLPLSHWEQLVIQHFNRFNCLIAENEGCAPFFKLFAESPQVKSILTLVSAGYGFQEPYINRIALDCLDQSKVSLLQKFRISIESSRYFLAICDPIGCLRSGEVFFNVPQAFGKKVVISRNPCKGPGQWMMAKNVFHSALAAYRNLIIFPSTDFESSLLCIGGDYDGDCVFVSWDDYLTDFETDPASFRTAPVDDIRQWIQPITKTAYSVFEESGSIVEASKEALRLWLQLGYGSMDYLLSNFEDRFPKETEMIWIGQWLSNYAVSHMKKGVLLCQKGKHFMDKVRSCNPRPPFWAKGGEPPENNQPTAMGEVNLLLKRYFSKSRLNLKQQRALKPDVDLLNYHMKWNAKLNAQALDKLSVEINRARVHFGKVYIELKESNRLDHYFSKVCECIRHTLFEFAEELGIGPGDVAVLSYIQSWKWFGKNSQNNSSQLPEGAFVWTVFGDYLARIKADELMKRRSGDRFAIASTSLNLLTFK
jgi:hypothetical protein